MADESKVIETPVEEVKTEEKPLTPEELEAKEKQEKFLRGGIIHKYHYHLRSIHDYMKSNKLTLEQVRDEILEKKCRLTTTQRDLVMWFKLDFMQQLLDDMYASKD